MKYKVHCMMPSPESEDLITVIIITVITIVIIVIE